MNQKQFDDLTKRVEDIEDGNGWHESAKYVLEKLDTLTDAVKENRIETGGKIDKMKDDNAFAHKALHDKMDAQKTTCANRPIECQKQFLPNKTFGWLVVILVVLFTASFSLSGTALKQDADHKVKVVEYKTLLDEERVRVDDKLTEIIADHKKCKETVRELKRAFELDKEVETNETILN